MTKCKLIKSFCFLQNILIPVELYIHISLWEKLSLYLSLSSHLVELQVPSLVVIGAVVAGVGHGVLVAVLDHARHGLQQTGVDGGRRRILRVETLALAHVSQVSKWKDMVNIHSRTQYHNVGYFVIS